MISIEYLRQFKIGPFAIFDTVISYLGILLLSPLLSWLTSKIHFKVPITSWLWFTMPLSVLFHVAFRQPTPLMKILGDASNFQFYIALVLLLGMTYMGFRGISRF